MKLDKGAKNNACIVGVGRSPISRDSGRTATSLASEAVVNAIKDAGLSIKDIDGLATNEYGMVNGYRMVEALRIPAIDWFGNMNTPQSTAAWAVMEAAMAVEYGATKYCVVYMGLMKPKGFGSRGSRRDPFAGVIGPPIVGGEAQWSAPFGGGGNFSSALYMTRYMSVYNAPRETFGHIAVTARKHAVMNERAIARAPLTMEDYLTSRWVSEPFCLYDCDYPVDGYAAVVLTTPDRARHLPNKPVQIVCGAQNTGPRTATMLWDDMTNMGCKYCCQKLWTLTKDLTIKDVDVACLYDGFTILTVNWIESVGFCKPGEAKDFLQGDMMQLGGTGVPLNPHGGQLSEGRVHGMGFVAEAVDQLFGRCGRRQVPNARIAVVGNGAGVQHAAMIFQRME